MSSYKQKKESLHSIGTLPIKMYYTISETGDLKGLKQSLSFANSEELMNRWAEINDDITNIAGVSETHIQILKHRIQKAVHIDAAHNKGEKWRLTLAKIEEANIRELEENLQKGSSLTENLLTLSKLQGYSLRADTLTTLEYFTLIKISNESDKK